MRINPLNAELNPICHLQVLLGDLTRMGPCIVSIFLYISNKMQRTQFIYIWKLLYMFRVVLPSIIRRPYNCIYSICYLSHRYCYLPLSWKSWNRFLCNVASCWIYIGILLGAHYILHISRIRVKWRACSTLLHFNDPTTMGYFSTSIKPLNVQSFPVIYSFALLGAYPCSKVINIGSKPNPRLRHKIPNNMRQIWMSCLLIFRFINTIKEGTIFSV